MHRYLVSLLLVAALAVSSARPSSGSRTQTADEWERGLAAAAEWLELIDDGKYAESWEEASELFRQNMRKLGKGKTFWEKALRATRAPLGALQERRLRTKELGASVVGAPPGQYMVLQYGASFEGKRVVEHLTLIREKDSSWRVYSYVADHGSR